MPCISILAIHVSFAFVCICLHKLHKEKVGVVVKLYVVRMFTSDMFASIKLSILLWYLDLYGWIAECKVSIIKNCTDSIAWNSSKRCILANITKGMKRYRRYKPAKYQWYSLKQLWNTSKSSIGKSLDIYNELLVLIMPWIAWPSHTTCVICNGIIKEQRS